MKFREFFSAPEGKRITEKYLYKVLISSICSILLCMGCLAGTTWAWFTVSIENEGNVIAVASNPEVVITVNDVGFESSSNLGSGTHIVRVTHASEPDDVQQKSTLYVTFSLNEEVQGYVMLNHENGYAATINITTDQECVLSWIVSWFMPDNAELVDNSIEVTVEETEPTEESTMTGEETADPTGTGTDHTGETTAPTGTGTDPTKGTTAPTGTGTDHTGETTAPPETETDPTKETTADTESSEVTSQPAESESEPAETEAVTESDTDAGGNET